MFWPAAEEASSAGVSIARNIGTQSPLSRAAPIKPRELQQKSWPDGPGRRRVGQGLARLSNVSVNEAFTALAKAPSPARPLR
jgi:hypothetical protein